MFHRGDGRVWLDMRETFSQAVRGAGLWHEDPMRRVTRHTLRHTTLSWMAQQANAAADDPFYSTTLAAVTKRR